MRNKLTIAALFLLLSWYAPLTGPVGCQEKSAWGADQDEAVCQEAFSHTTRLHLPKSSGNSGDPMADPSPFLSGLSFAPYQNPVFFFFSQEATILSQPGDIGRFSRSPPTIPIRSE